MKKLFSIALAAAMVASTLALGSLAVAADDAPSTSGAENISSSARAYAFENPSEWADYGSPVGAIFNVSDSDLASKVEALFNADGYAIVRINDKNITVPNTAETKAQNYANSGGSWLRINVESNGAVLYGGVTYQVSLYLCESNGTVKYYTEPSALVGAETKGTPARDGSNVIIDASKLTAAKLSYVEGSLTGLTPWGDNENAPKLFDGDTTGTKLGGGVSGGTAALEFTSESAISATYYALVTGGDTASNASRNPAGWTLYGKSGSEWKVIDKVEATTTATTGLEATNSTPYYYKVDAPASYSEYKIEFACGGSFQMNELQLFTGTAIEIPGGIVASKYISTVDEYIAFVNEANEQGDEYMRGQTVAIIADLDFTGKTVPTINKGKFLLDGCGKTLSNITTTVEAATNGTYGLIANEMSNNNFNGTIQNLTLKNCSLTVTGEAENVNVGAVVGRADRAKVNTITLDGVTIKVEGVAHVGSLIGRKEWQAANDSISAITLKNVVIDAPKAIVGILVGSADQIDGTISNITGSIGVKSSNTVTATTWFGSTTDSVSMTPDDSVKNGITITDPDAPVTPPETPVEPPKTGDIAVALSALALVAVAGAVVVARKRKIED
ncbi:MAG: hypothetical protein ACI3XR_07630 [Eubacteriales bacterium]